MKQAQPVLDEVIAMAHRLGPRDKLQLMGRLMPDLEAWAGTGSAVPLRSAYGACADLGSAPSEEDIRRTREEMFGDFAGNDRP